MMGESTLILGFKRGQGGTQHTNQWCAMSLEHIAAPIMVKITLKSLSRIFVDIVSLKLCDLTVIP